MKLVWKRDALEDREQIMDFIARNNPQAALDLDERFEKKADLLLEYPKLHKTGRVKGTREAVVHPNYVMVYSLEAESVHILRVLHSARHWGEDS